MTIMLSLSSSTEVPCGTGLGMGPFVGLLLYGADISWSWCVLWGLGIRTVTEASGFSYHNVCH